MTSASMSGYDSGSIASGALRRCSPDVTSHPPLVSRRHCSRICSILGTRRWPCHELPSAGKSQRFCGAGCLPLGQDLRLTTRCHEPPSSGSSAVLLAILTGSWDTRSRTSLGIGSSWWSGDRHDRGAHRPGRARSARRIVRRAARDHRRRAPADAAIARAARAAHGGRDVRAGDGRDGGRRRVQEAAGGPRAPHQRAARPRRRRDRSPREGRDARPQRGARALRARGGVALPIAVPRGQAHAAGDRPSPGPAQKLGLSAPGNRGVARGQRAGRRAPWPRRRIGSSGARAVAARQPTRGHRCRGPSRADPGPNGAPRQWAAARSRRRRRRLGHGRTERAGVDDARAHSDRMDPWRRRRGDPSVGTSAGSTPRADVTQQARHRGASRARARARRAAATDPPPHRRKRCRPGPPARNSTTRR